MFKGRGGSGGEMCSLGNPKRRGGRKVVVLVNWVADPKPDDPVT